MALKSQPLLALIGTTSPVRAKTFYRDALGLKLVGEDEFALVFDAAGTMLRVSVVPHVQPAPYAVLGWRVTDIRRTIRRLSQRGVVFLRYSGMTQDEMGIWTSPSGARVAWFTDPNGNTLSLTEQARPAHEIRLAFNSAHSGRKGSGRGRGPNAKRHVRLRKRKR